MGTNLGFISPKTLSKSENSEICLLLKDANKQAGECSDRIYGKSNISRFYRDFSAGTLSNKLSKNEQNLFESTLDQSYNLLQGYCRAASKLARSFSGSKPACGLTYEDFYQVGCMAICECVLGFNGKATLTTFVVNSIKNKMIDMIRGDDFLSPKAADIRKLAAKIKQYINSNSVSFEEAVSALGISNKKAEVCKHSMTKVWTGYCQEDQFGEPFNGAFTDNSSSMEREVAELKEIIKKSGLTDVEMKLVENYLWGHQTLREFVQDHINPKTNRSMSVQWASYTLKAAIENIKEKAAA